MHKTSIGGRRCRPLVHLDLALASWSNAHFGHRLWGKGVRRATFLPRYMDLFSAVEVDRTFHGGVPADEGLGGPRLPAARFWPKLDKRATHGAKDKGALAAVEAFTGLVAPLVDAGVMGRVVVQFPATFRRSDRQHRALERILELLTDAGLAASVELRHDSWDVPATEALLRHRGAVFVWSTFEGAPRSPWLTADEGHVRLVGRQREGRTKPHALRDRSLDLDAVRWRLDEFRPARCLVVATNRFEGDALWTLPRAAAALGVPFEAPATWSRPQLAYRGRPSDPQPGSG